MSHFVDSTSNAKPSMISCPFTAPGVAKKEVRAPPKPVAFAAPPAFETPPNPNIGTAAATQSAKPPVAFGSQPITTPAAAAPAGVSSTAADEKSFTELFDEVMEKRNAFFAREAPALAFSKSKKVRGLTWSLGFKREDLMCVLV